ncbi:hypothetical protein ACH42_12155 [Endozoicomonas sp. (ex Bugula neritina AB1)]|nr:hypothetical protein ACH42_12155 [Endozoicomonas sp. (ex Bugula neritina AB1)]
MDTNRIRIIQITDTHLFNNNDEELLGVQTRESLDAVLELIHAKYADFECLLVTGDLTQDGSTSSYGYLKEVLTRFNKPFYWLCGNHDVPEIMDQVSPEAMVKRVPVGNWQLLLLNSQLPGSVHGHLSDSELETLSAHLQEHPHLNTLIAFHHHPAAIDSVWMDRIALDNPVSLEQITKQHQQVKCIIHGHIHQDIEYSFANTPVLATPSTCVQFTPHSEEFQVDTSLPGFRVLDLFPDGRFETQVIRLKSFPMRVNQALNGY